MLFNEYFSILGIFALKKVMNIATNQLPNIDKEILSYISSWLEFQDIISLGLTQKSLKFVLNSKPVWNLQIRNYLPPLKLISDKIPKTHPKDFFVLVISKFRNFRDLFANIITKVNPNMNAKRWLESNYKKNIRKKKEIENIIIENYHSIPMDYYLLFRFLNGQDELLNYFPNDICFFGGYSYNEKYFEFEYLPFSQPEFPFLQKLKFHTLAINRDRGIRYYVDFHNVLQNGMGSIFSFLSQRYENGTLIFRIFIFKKSITQLLEDLQHCAFSAKKGLIDHFDTLCCPESDVTTDGIRIRVSSIFNPWEMSANGFLFAYQIRVSANGLKGKWRLTCRHLIITDGNNQEEVEGVELNGKAYEISQNGEDFVYESWIYTQSLTTTLKGYFYFVNTTTSQEVRAQIGETTMQFPKGCCLIDFNESDLSMKVLIDRRENSDKL